MQDVLVHILLAELIVEIGSVKAWEVLRDDFQVVPATGRESRRPPERVSSTAVNRAADDQAAFERERNAILISIGLLFAAVLFGATWTASDEAPVAARRPGDANGRIARNQPDRKPDVNPPAEFDRTRAPLLRGLDPQPAPHPVPPTEQLDDTIERQRWHRCESW